MARDPVCGTLVDERHAEYEREYQGAAYYFCSPECQRQFEQQPHRFADQRPARTIQPNESGPCTS